MYPRFGWRARRRLWRVLLARLLAAALATTVFPAAPVPTDTHAAYNRPALPAPEIDAAPGALDRDLAMALSLPVAPATLALTPAAPAAPTGLPDDEDRRHLPLSVNHDPPPPSPTVPPPAASPTQTVRPAPPPWTHLVVKRGDTLWGLAWQNGTTIDALITVNARTTTKES